MEVLPPLLQRQLQQLLVLLPVLVLLPAQPIDCLLSVRFNSQTERAVRTWRTQRLLAQYSDRAHCLAVLFSSMPHHPAVGAYELTLTSVGGGGGSGRDVGPMLVTGDSVKHFLEGGATTLLTVPMSGVFLGTGQAYKLHLLPLLYRNETEVGSVAMPSQLGRSCYVTFRPGVPTPPSPPSDRRRARDCASPAALVARLEPELGLRLRVGNNDGDGSCCLGRLGEEAAPATGGDNVNDGDTTTTAAAIVVVAAVLAALLATGCTLLVVRAARLLRRPPRLVAAPSGAPYSLLAAHCRCVHSREPLLFQGNAFRFRLLRPRLGALVGCRRVD